MKNSKVPIAKSYDHTRKLHFFKNTSRGIGTGKEKKVVDTLFIFRDLTWRRNDTTMQNGSKKLVNWGKEAEFSKRAVETQSQLGSSTAASNTEIDLLFLTEFPGDVATLQKIHAAIVESWKLFGARFREYWSSLSLELRRDFISAFAPNLAKSVCFTNKLSSNRSARLTNSFFLFPGESTSSNARRLFDARL